MAATYSSVDEAKTAMCQIETEIRQINKDIAQLEDVYARVSELLSQIKHQNEERWSAFRKMNSIFSVLGVLSRSNSLLSRFQSDFQSSVLGTSYDSMVSGLTTALQTIQGEIDRQKTKITSLNTQYQNASSAVNNTIYLEDVEIKL